MVHTRVRAHTHSTHLLGRRFLFIEQSPCRLPDGESCKNWCKKEADLGLSLGRGGHYGGLAMWGPWRGVAAPAYSGKGNSLRLWRQEAPGSMRRSTAARLVGGRCIPSGSRPHLRRYSRKQCVQQWQATPQLLCSWKRGQMGRASHQERSWFVSRSKLALAVHKWRMRFVASTIGRLPHRGFGKTDELLVIFFLALWICCI